MRKPKLSGWLTDEDIRKIRQWAYETTKDMNNEDFIAFYRKRAERVLKRKVKFLPIEKELKRINGL
jgi:hypothetical protein